MDSNIIIAIILVIFAFVVLFWMSSNEKKKKKKYSNSTSVNSKSQNSINSNNDFNVDLYSLKFPFLIEKMEHNHLSKAYEVIYDTFGFLDYQNKSSDDLMEKEWHTWQMAILLKCLSKKIVFSKPNAKDMIPNEIKKLSKDSLDMELKFLVSRFNKEVDIHESKEVLCEELNWTARDVSIILMCIINEDWS